jgi:hypothetical protein
MANKLIINKKKAPPAVFMNFFKDWHEWWEGFSEQKESRLPTIEEKQQMLRYPICISVIQHKILPLLAPHITIDGDERQAQYLQHWFDNHYRRCTKLMYKKSTAWGFAVGERVIETEYIDNKPYWMHTRSFIPEPYNSELKFSDKKPDIAGFKYATYQIDRYDKRGQWMIPGMVYMNYEGDETSVPYGDSILNKMFWAWQLVMKTWTALNVYQHLQPPFLKYFYIPEKYGDDDNKAVNQARTQALADMKKMKNTGGVVLEKVQNDKDEWVKGADFEVTAPPDKETTYHESIRILNSLMYAGCNFPERMQEQFKDTGSQGMVKEQSNYYTEYILPDDITAAENHCHTWFTNPMLEVNFGKIDCTYEFHVSDKQKKFYVQLLEKLIQSGETIGELDTRQIAEAAGVPVMELKKPTIETTERKVIIPGLDKTEFAAKQGDDKKRIKKWADKVVNTLNEREQNLKVKAYTDLKGRLEQQRGKIALRVEQLYKKGVPKDKDLQKALQIPNNVFTNVKDYLLQSWDIGQRFFFEDRSQKPLDKPLTETADKIRGLNTDVMGSSYLAGECELLERRLYRIMKKARPVDALGQLNTEMKNYIDHTLPTRLQDWLHRAVLLGTFDFVKFTQLEDARQAKEGK